MNSVNLLDKKNYHKLISTYLVEVFRISLHRNAGCYTIKIIVAQSSQVVAFDVMMSA